MIRKLIVALLLASNVAWSQVDSVQFITKDVDEFWKAYDVFKEDTALNPFDAYLDNATAAIKHLRKYAIRDSLSFRNSILANMRYYDQVRPSSYQMFRFRKKITSYFNTFRSMYPAAEIPVVYFAIGNRNVGSTTCPEGVIIGMEKFSDTTVTDSHGYTSISLERLPMITLASFIFYQQKPAHTGHNLLRQCIVHGSADFLSALILGDEKNLILKQENYIYGDQHEELLVREFLGSKNSDDFSGWLYNYKPDQKRPNDLGAWIGYKITEAYYNNASDKQKAVDDILKINDFENFLVLSGYAEIFRK